MGTAADGGTDGRTEGGGRIALWWREAVAMREDIRRRRRRMAAQRTVGEKRLRQMPQEGDFAQGRALRRWVLCGWGLILEGTSNVRKQPEKKGLAMMMMKKEAILRFATVELFATGCDNQ
jgi:hypothetical protein